jgi:threonine dehydrogenase-like Zn-dependent dehydrogenase
LASKFERYRDHDYPVPETMLSWEVTGAGFENVGAGGKPVRIPVPKPGPNEVLCRVDAVGLCFSDVKMIMAGNAHPRMYGRDLATEPTRGGHEASLTVVAAGKGEEADYKFGERYLLQADVYWKGRTLAVGYVIPGAMSEYMIMPKVGLHGDDGSYLVPIERDGLGYAEGALVEPWACIEASYRIPVRKGPLEGGRGLVVNVGGGDAVPDGIGPDTEVVVLSSPTVEEIRAVGGNAGSAEGLTQETAEQPGFDDCFLVGAGPESREVVEACLDALRRDGHLCVLGAGELPHEVDVDVGRLHYHGIRNVAGATVEEAYRANLRQELLGGGAVHFSGAGGPMGQMHAQRAIEHDEPPATVVVTDISVDRLAHIEMLLGHVARERGVKLVCLNPRDFPDTDAFEGALLDATGGKGFDDIVLCAPVAELVTAAARQAAPRGIVNAFAGLPVGNAAGIDLDAVVKRNVRLTGSSGSALADMESVIGKVVSGALRTGRSIAALGGFAQTLEGLVGLKEGRYPGKTVVFPGVPDFALIPPGEIGSVAPDVAELLDPGGVWSKAAEEAFLEKRLVLPD